jgi:ABC-2 type transport system ATP-binding protein
MLIELEHVTKSYRSRGGGTRAVDDLSMSIPSGGVHGFLGPNGSGKTTTIRILLGLVAPSSGTVRVMGAQIPGGLASVAGSIGALVETPALFGPFSGRRNLQILARLGGLDESRVEWLLDLVGLQDRGEDRVKGYSLGMRQRLAIAAAMLKSPTLLILDEPTNGLDPAGMVEVRELVRRLGSDGRTTVFLSSHLLTEVGAVCDAVTILQRGRLVTSGSVAEVLARAGSGDRLTVTFDADPAAAVAALAAAGITATVSGPGSVLVDSADGARVNWALASAGIWARGIAAETPDLEQAFLNLTEERNHT